MTMRLNKEQKLMAEEIADRFPNAKILPPLGEPGKLDIREMHAIYHNRCRHVAFYYTHRPKRGEMLLATRAKYPDGSRPDRSQKMMCGSCKEYIEFAGELIT